MGAVQDVLAATSDTCLEGYANGFLEHEAIKQTPASITYRLWQYELGELGTVEIRKIRLGFSEIRFKGLAINSVDTAPAWKNIKPEWNDKIKKSMRGLPKEQAIDKYLEISREMDEIKKEIKARQKRHLANVIKAYFNRLIHENIWEASEPPKYLYNFCDADELDRVWSRYNDGKSPSLQAKKDKGTSPKIIAKLPWELSRPHKRDRDRIIWNMRSDNATWDAIYAELNKNPETYAAMSTIKSNYARMVRLQQTIG